LFLFFFFFLLWCDVLICDVFDAVNVDIDIDIDIVDVLMC